MRRQGGYVLLELVVGAAITCAIAGVLFQFAIAAQAAVGIQGDAGDEQQRLRVAVESLRHDLNLAGAGPSRGAGRGPLISVFAPVLPARVGVSGADPELTVRTDRISVMYVPDTRAQSTLQSAMAAVTSPLAIDGTASGCAPGTACDFAAGDRALIYEPRGEGSAHELFTVASVDAPRSIVIPAAPLSRVYEAGARVTAVVVRTYYLDRAGKRLMLYDGDRSDLPLVDHVVLLRFGYVADPRPDAVLPPQPGFSSCVYAGVPPAPLLASLGGTSPKLLSDAQLADGPFCGAPPNRFDADLLRVRQIRVTIGVESESADKAVRDLQVTIGVTPRNMAAW